MSMSDIPISQCLLHFFENNSVVLVLNNEYQGRPPPRQASSLLLYQPSYQRSRLLSSTWQALRHSEWVGMGCIQPTAAGSKPLLKKIKAGKTT